MFKLKDTEEDEEPACIISGGVFRKERGDNSSGVDIT